MRRRVTVLVLCVCVCVCVSVCTPAPTTLVSTLKMGYVGVYLRLFLTSSQAFSLLQRLVSFKQEIQSLYETWTDVHLHFNIHVQVETILSKCHIPVYQSCNVHVYKHIDIRQCTVHMHIHVHCGVPSIHACI